MSEINPGGSRWPREEVPASDLLEWYSHAGDHALRYIFAREFCKNGVVVDIGCGGGFGALALEGVVRKYIGLDVDREAIEWAKNHIANRFPWAEFHVIDRTRDIREWRACDLAIAFEVIEHLHDPEMFLRDMEAMVMPRGTCLISTPNGDNSKGRPELYVSPFHVREFRISEVADLLRGSHLSAQYFIEYRIDRMDLLGRRALGRPLGRSLEEGVPSVKSGLLWRLNDLWNERLNGPSFWRIKPIDLAKLTPRLFSTIIVNLSPQKGTGELAGGKSLQRLGRRLRDMRAKDRHLEFNDGDKVPEMYCRPSRPEGRVQEGRNPC